MKSHISFLTATCVLLLAGCTSNDPALEELKQKQEAEAQRLAALKESVDGLKKSDTPFSLVLAEAPADTVSKGLDFTSTVRVNPSGVAMTKDMIALDYISGKQFYRVEPNRLRSPGRPVYSHPYHLCERSRLGRFPNGLCGRLCR